MRAISFAATAAAAALALAGCGQQAERQADAPAGAEAQQAAADLTALNGTWKVDQASIKFEGKPNEYLLQGGQWTCNSCIPPLKVAADGQFHAVADRPYYDSISVKAVDDRTVEIRRRKDGKEVSSNVLRVAGDGNRMALEFTDATTPNAPPVKGTTALRRSGQAPAGAHAVSGQWMPEKVEEYSAEALDITFRVEGNKVTMNSQGQTYTAEIDGPPVAVQGDTGGTMVALTREGAGGIRETATRKGETIGVATFVPSADGQTLTFTNTDSRNGNKTSWTARKQS